MADMVTTYIEVLGHRVKVDMYEELRDNPLTWSEAIAKIESVIRDGCFDDDCKWFRWTVISNVNDRETIQSVVSFSLSKAIDSYRQVLIDNGHKEDAELFGCIMDSFGQFADDSMGNDIENWYADEGFRELISPLLDRISIS